MHHHLGGKAAAQPEVLGQVGVGGRQVGAVVAEAGVAVIAPFWLHHHRHLAKPGAGDGKSWLAGGVSLQGSIGLRWAPHLLQPRSTRRWQLAIPVLVTRQGEMAEGGAVATLRVVGAAGQQQGDQGGAIGR